VGTLAGLSLGAHLQQTVKGRVSRRDEVSLPVNVMAPLLVLKHLARPAGAAEIARELPFETPAVANALSRWMESGGVHFITRSGDGRYWLTLRGHRLAAELAFEGDKYLVASRS
jgi:hypothetical protein